MRRWVTIGALVLVGLWGPFLYRELTSERVEKKNGSVLADDLDDAPAEAAEGAGAAEAPPPGGEGADEPAEEPAAAETEQADEGEEPEAPSEPAAPPDDLAPAQEGTPTPTEPAAAVDDKAADDAPAGELPTAAAIAAVPPMPTSTTVLRRVFDSEPRDALWAREAEAKLLQLITGAAVPLDTIKSTRCQKTVCRVEFSWKADDATAYHAAFKNVRETFGEDLGIQNLGPGEQAGEQRIDLYVPREGYTLADLER